MSRKQRVEQLAGRLRAYGEQVICEVIADGDAMLIERDAEHRAHYLRVGREAAELCAEALLLAGSDRVDTALDLPCGHGRVLRHLVNFLPRARIVAADVDPAGLAFCRAHFDVDTLRCAEEPAEQSFDTAFDLIWCGSLLTHLPEASFHALLALLARSLSVRGVVVATLHGRFSPYVQAHRFRYTSDADFAVAEAQYRERGFGFVAYPGTPRLGVALARPSFVLRAVEELDGVRILGYRERAWDDHQDVLVFGKPPTVPEGT